MNPGCLISKANSFQHNAPYFENAQRINALDTAWSKGSSKIQEQVYVAALCLCVRDEQKVMERVKTGSSGIYCGRNVRLSEVTVMILLLPTSIILLLIEGDNCHSSLTVDWTFPLNELVG